MEIFRKIQNIMGIQRTMEDQDADIDEIIGQMNASKIDTRQSIERVQLKSDVDVDAVIGKLAENKIVIVDMRPLLMNRETLKKLITKLSESCERMKWQICRISNEMVIVTPNNIKINTGI